MAKRRLVLVRRVFWCEHMGVVWYWPDTRLTGTWVRRPSGTRDQFSNDTLRAVLRQVGNGWTRVTLEKDVDLIYVEFTGYFTNPIGRAHAE